MKKGMLVTSIPFLKLSGVYMKDNRQTARGIVYILLSAIGFGMLPTFNHLGSVAGLSTWDRVAIRYLGSAIVVFPYILAKRLPIIPAQRVFVKIFIVSVFFFGLTSVLLFLGYETAPSGLVTIIHFLYPILVMIICTTTGREQLAPSAVFASMISLFGLFVIMEPWKFSGIPWKGYVLALGSAATFSLYVISLTDREITKVDNAVLVFWLTSISGTVALVLAIIFHRLENSVQGTLDMVAAVPSSLGLVLVSTVGAASLFSLGNRKIGPSTASLLSLLEPITAIIMGNLLLGEPLSLSFFIGALFIIGSSVVISVSKLKSCGDPVQPSH